LKKNKGSEENEDNIKEKENTNIKHRNTEKFNNKGLSDQPRN